MKRFNFITLLIILALVLGVSHYFLVQADRTRARVLASQEIKQYQGKDLSSVNDFVENSIKGPQYVDKNKYRLAVTGLVQQPQSLTYDQVVSKYQSYKKAVKLDCVEGWSVNILWEGLLMRDLFADAKPLPAANTVIFHAVDGYTTSFPLGYFYTNDILMAYKMNGLTIPPERGFPFMLVAESKWGYKWIKWIDKIEFSSSSTYQGYWESRGYSNSGDLNKPF